MYLYKLFYKQNLENVERINSNNLQYETIHRYSALTIYLYDLINGYGLTDQYYHNTQELDNRVVTTKEEFWVASPTMGRIVTKTFKYF